MDIKDADLLDLKDQIIILFRPIEQLFKIMDKSSIEVFGELTRCHAEVGLVLCQNFRQKIDIVLKNTSSESYDE